MLVTVRLLRLLLFNVQILALTCHQLLLVGFLLIGHLHNRWYIICIDRAVVEI